LREQRLAKFLTQDELAERSGVSRPTINRIETAKAVPRPGTVRRLAQALELRPGDIVARPQMLWDP